MKILTNKDIRYFLILLSCVSVGMLVLLQLMLWLSYGELKPAVLLLSLLAVLSILGVCFLYFQKQNQRIENAIAQIDRYLAGDTSSRIACDEEGSLYKLFHAVNTLATALGAHAAKEQKGKEFLKETISDISHQLKTPLAALAIYNGLMQDESEEVASVRAFAKKSEHELDRIDTLVQSLLKITRLDSGSILIERTSTNIAELMEDVRCHFEFRMREEQKTITLSGDESAHLLCDRDWMTEAISNLVKNALDHTSAGGHIDIVWKQLPSITQITIKDNGCGIHPEDIHHIFKRFYRSRFSKDTQGLGLGLPLAKAIVEAHDGAITVDSTLGAGTRFDISFVNLTKL
ncbi:MAG: HAMP domain-containing sensor histidine kinase [Ruthenibacterium sp.]